MKDNSRELLSYMYRHMTENSVRKFNVRELPNTTGISYLARKGFVTAEKFGTMQANISMTTKGLDWVKENKAPPTTTSTSTIQQAAIQNGEAVLSINSELYDHVKSFMDSGHYFSAVEEAYKYVRERLREITGEEQASEVFNMNAESTKFHEVIFGRTAQSGSPEGNFFRGVGYLHLAIQFLRNEKAHTLATTVDKNLAIHYISLAGLAYDLISRSNRGS